MREDVYRLQSVHRIFERCVGTSSLNCASETVARVNEEAFKNASIKKITLHTVALAKFNTVQVPTSCVCKTECKIKRYICVKRGVRNT